jgi:hypothetical protein
VVIGAKNIPQADSSKSGVANHPINRRSEIEYLVVKTYISIGRLIVFS